MKRKLLWLGALIAGLVLAIGLTTASAKAATKDVTTRKADGTTETHTYTSVDSWDALKTAVAGGTDVYAYFTADGVAGDAISLAADQKVYVDLAGHRLYKEANSRFFNLGAAGAQFVLTDSVGGGSLDGGTTIGNQWIGYARFIDINAAATVILDNVKLEKGACGNNAGAIMVRGADSKLYMYDATIDSCWTNKSTSGNGIGGAIYASNNALIEMHDSTISNCYSNVNAGGAVGLTNTAELRMYGTSKIVDCESKANNSGAIWFGDTAKLYMYDDSEIKNCTAKTNGGAISCAGTNKYEIHMYNNAKMSGCSAPSLGGTIVLNGGTLTMHDNAEISGGRCESANASAYAGNVRIMAGRLEMYDNSLIDGGWTDKYAGNVSLTTGTIHMEGGTISGGYAKHTGGNITVVSAGGKIEMSGTAKIINGQCDGYTGGNISYNAAGTLTMADNAEISGGTSYDAGGNVSFAAGSTFTMSGGKISGGESTNTCGGNVNFNGSCTVTISGGLIEGGKAKTHSGNVRFNSSNVTMTGGTIKGGESGTHGGTATCSGTLTMSGDAVISGEGGSSTTMAGVLYFDGASLTMSGNAKITKGTAATNGGCIVVGSGTTLTMQDNAEISYGETDNQAGNIQLSGKLIMSGNAKVLGGEVKAPISFTESGSVKTGFAGSIFVTSSGSITMSGNSEISGGVATAYAGNVALTGASTLTMSENAAIKDGTAGTNGGNVTVTGAGTLTMSDKATISGGTAGTTGGNLQHSAGGTFTMSGGYIIGGTAVNGAGNVNFSGTSNAKCVVKITAGQITDGVVTGEEAVAPDVYLNGGNVLPEISGGYFATVVGSSGFKETGFITGGYFIECPDVAFSAEVDGKALIAGNEKNYENPDPTDSHIYHYTLESVEEAGAILIEADTEFPLAGYTAAVKGAGYYMPGQAYELTVTPVSKFTFVGWDVNGELSEAETYEGTATSNLTVIAVFAVADGYFPVTIVPDEIAKFSYAIGTGAATEATASVTLLVKATDNITLTDTTEETFFWVNASDKILKEVSKSDPEYSFTANGPITVFTNKPAQTDGVVPVIFYTEYDQIYAVTELNVDNVYDFELPTKPFRKGRNITWQFTNDDGDVLTDDDEITESVIISAAAMIDDYTTDILRVYTISEAVEGETYAITVKTAGGETVFETNVPLGKAAGIVLPAKFDGKALSAVKTADGKVVSYQRTFEYKSFADVELTATYDDAEPAEDYALTVAIASSESGVATIAVARAFADNYAIVEQGIRISKDASADLANGGTGVIQATSNDTENVGVTTVNVRTSGTVYAMGFAVVSVDGDFITVLTDKVTVAVQ